MTGLEKVYSYAKDQRIFVHFGEIGFAKAITVKDGDYFNIAVDRAAASGETGECALLIHELAHIATGSFYFHDTPIVQKRRQEERAFRWSAQFCVPPDKIQSAIKSGITKVYELAEFFDVSEEYLNSCLKYYKGAKNISFQGS